MPNMMPLDPFQYIGRVLERNEDGSVKTMRVHYPEDTGIELDRDDPTKNNFITFVSVTDLKKNPNP